MLAGLARKHTPVGALMCFQRIPHFRPRQQVHEGGRAAWQRTGFLREGLPEEFLPPVANGRTRVPYAPQEALGNPAPPSPFSHRVVAGFCKTFPATARPKE